MADTYARVGERDTGPPARDLVTLLEIRPSGLVLDIGAGTGVASRAAVEAGGVVIGVDLSPAMLAQARARGGGPSYAVASAIDLPFRDATFHYLIANFVLSHFTRYDTALFDMLRVLAPGGRLAVSNWAEGEDDDELSTAWRSVAEEFAESEILSDAHDRAVPWEGRFSDPTALKDALHESGVRDIWIEQREYRVEMTTDEYLVDRGSTSVGRFLHQMLGEELWGTFQGRAREVFAERFPERFNDFHRALLAVGHKP